MDGILEQILQELKEINKKLGSSQSTPSIQASKTAIKIDDLPDVLTIDDIKSFLRIGITQSYRIINLPDFTRLNMGRKICITKEQFLKWHEKEQRKRMIGLK